MHPTSYTSELVARLRADYEAGKAARAIAEEHKVDRATMMRHLRKAGVIIRRQGLSDAQAEQAAAMYRSGMTQAQIAAEFGVSQKTAGRYLHLVEVGIRPPLTRSAPSK
jgi:DNA-binding transcriptional regulator LsrR (DeoR family)